MRSLLGVSLILIGGSLGGCQLFEGDFKIDTGKLEAPCEPNATRCSGNQIQRCLATGKDWQTLASCRSSEECNLATLTCAKCDAESAECDDAQPKQCDASGTWQTVGQPCASAALCNVAANGASASCLGAACSVGQVTCMDQTLERCRADLSGWQPLENCSSAMACTAATAAAMAADQSAFPRCGGDADTSMLQAPVLPCELNQFQCTDAALKRCTLDGVNVQQLEQCDTTALCNTELGRCFQSKCVALAIRCVGDVKQQCREDRTGWDLPITCGLGLCDPQIPYSRTPSDADCATTQCTEGEYRCNDVELERCMNGVWTGMAPCDKAEQCDAMNGVCKPAP